MKLNAAQLRTVERTLGTEALPDGHAVIPQLREAFGDHTFFLDDQGLNIIEPNPSPAKAKGIVLTLATWQDNHSDLRRHEPHVLPVEIDFGGSDLEPEP